MTLDEAYAEWRVAIQRVILAKQVGRKVVEETYREAVAAQHYRDVLWEHVERELEETVEGLKVPADTEGVK